jgi:hypothetical protein
MNCIKQKSPAATGHLSDSKRHITIYSEMNNNNDTLQCQAKKEDDHWFDKKTGRRIVGYNGGKAIFEERDRRSITAI